VIHSKCVPTAAVASLMLAVQAVTAQTAPTPAPPGAAAQVQPPPPVSAAPDPVESPAAWKLGPLDLSGVVDGYYSIGFNHPADQENGLRNFDDKANQFELNMAMLTVDLSPKPLGFHLEAGAGRAFDIMSATEKDATAMRFFEQAYIDLKPESWQGLELDFGRFTTFAGAEVIETSNNFNYSRSLLFAWAEPYYHFGFRATRPIGKRFNLGFELVSGWNNVVTGATFKTVGLTGSWIPTSKVTWTNTYYGGPDENEANRGMRQLYDTVLQLAPNRSASFYLNFDYLHDSPRYTRSGQVYGIAGAAKFQLTRKLVVSQRLEWLNDNLGMATGTSQQVKEFTVTGTYALLARVSGWLEFRNDWSNQPFFDCGDKAASQKQQPTLLVGIVAVIAPQR